MNLQQATGLYGQINQAQSSAKQQKAATARRTC
jgi:hypothetical protein